MSREVPDWIDGYVEYTQFSEPKESYRRWSAISAVAGALQRKCVLNWGMLTFYPNLYVILVGPAAARKGTAMTPALKILTEIGVKLASDAATKEAFELQMVAAAANAADADTMEVRMHSSLTAYNSEVTVLLGYKNPELMTRLCKWYDCEDNYIYKTKNSGEASIQGVFLNLFGCTTPDQLQLALPLEAIGGGLTSRIIFIYEQGPGKREVIPFMDVKLRDALVRDLARIKAMSGVFKVTPEFLDAYSDWYLKSDPTPLKNPKFESYCARRANHIFKLCMIMSASRSDSLVLERRDFEKALSTLLEAERNMEMTFYGIGKSKTADVTDKVIVYLAANREVTLTQLTQTFYRDADAQTLHDIIRTLLAMGKAELVTKEPGKPQVLRLKE